MERKNAKRPVQCPKNDARNDKNSSASQTSPPSHVSPAPPTDLSTPSDHTSLEPDQSTSDKPVTNEQVTFSDSTEREIVGTTDGSAVNTEKVDKKKDGSKPLPLIKPLSIKNKESDSDGHTQVENEELKNCLNDPNPLVKVWNLKV